MTAFPWHRVFHPLCGADPFTLLGLTLRAGPPSARGAAPFAVALALSLLRAPFTLLDLAVAARDRRPLPAPVFIVGYPRSGTTHLHNLMAASGAFATAPPVLAALPWEGRTVAPVAKPYIDMYLPETRLIDGVAMDPEAPTEDEVGLANMTLQSYFHAVYFPRRFARDYHDGLAGVPTRGRERALKRYVSAMARDGRPLLLKNPAYTAQVDVLFRLFPGARVVHIHRDPYAVFASGRRALRRTMAEVALQAHAHVNVEAALLRTYPATMRRLRETSRGLPPERFAEVSYEAVAADPRGTLRRLWDQLALPAPPGAMERVDAHLRSVAGFRPEGARLSPAERERLRLAWSEEVALYASSAEAAE